MLINKLMSVQLGMVHWDDIEEISLSSELNEIVTQGFVEMDGCFLSKKLLSYCQSNSPSNFEDEIAFECFVNSIHMEDYVNEKHFEYSIVFSNSVINKWNKDHADNLNFIISLDDETLLPTIKFHLRREGASWLNEDNLDSSIQAVLITTDEITYNKV
ncbi:MULTISPECIES: hypothetical protein [Photorhabdus]|uniref:Uncharacterized protein n=2 Tax=Photorhabdus TaxID=29487 RepID=A0A329VAB6_9GAMM|nr:MULTISPECIES: hypothetical protein [Photorhabdus]MBS9444379.1 hypothetical protein [Photorhabdus heterorhabditis]NHB89026.1 hypothetical protein [Photorhabdus tasmaniensis]PQQ41106.1 hypothetical protein C6H65_11410 [Photorhabdus luminescens]RAW82501.1 hypothetical protein CKY01_21990 [Photorhabdus laumondii subsp. clarkei]